MAAYHFVLLAMAHSHALLAGSLTHEHREPFDRMLAAQALIEDATLITDDAALRGFGARTLW